MNVSCKCLCSINHPEERGICLAEAETVVIYNSTREGQKEIDMCFPCSRATLLGNRRGAITHKQAESED
jgi:hypothetical protein